MGIAVKLTLEGINQVWYPETWFFVMVAAICVVTQMIYLNKVRIIPVLVVSVSCSVVHFGLCLILACLFLFWPGAGHFQRSNSFSNLLCDVHNTHNCC